MPKLIKREALLRTVVVGKGQDIALIIDPGLDAHKVGHEGGNRTFQNRCIAPDHILGHNLGLVELIHN